MYCTAISIITYIRKTLLCLLSSNVSCKWCVFLCCCLYKCVDVKIDFYLNKHFPDRKFDDVQEEKRPIYMFSVCVCVDSVIIKHIKLNGRTCQMMIINIFIYLLFWCCSFFCCVPQGYYFVQAMCMYSVGCSSYIYVGIE